MPDGYTEHYLHVPSNGTHLPVCNRCGAIVWDKKAHTEFHDQQDGDSR